MCHVFYLSTDDCGLLGARLQNIDNASLKLRCVWSALEPQGKTVSQSFVLPRSGVGEECVWSYQMKCPYLFPSWWNKSPSLYASYRDECSHQETLRICLHHSNVKRKCSSESHLSVFRFMLCTSFRLWF